MACCPACEDWCPHRALPIVFGMVEPVRGLDQDLAAADRGHGKTDAVRCRAEGDFLAIGERTFRRHRRCLGGTGWLRARPFLPVPPPRGQQTPPPDSAPHALPRPARAP